MKTLENERYVVIKAYKCTVSEIWRDSSFVLASVYCVYVVSLYTVYITESTDCDCEAGEVGPNVAGKNSRNNSHDVCEVHRS